MGQLFFFPSSLPWCRDLQAVVNTLEVSQRRYRVGAGEGPAQRKASRMSIVGCIRVDYPCWKGHLCGHEEDQQ